MQEKRWLPRGRYGSGTCRRTEQACAPPTGSVATVPRPSARSSPRTGADTAPRRGVTCLTSARGLWSDAVHYELDEPIRVVEWDPAWPAAAETVMAECRAALGRTARAVEHIGSTAVPGLAAKPILDVLVGVPDGRRLVAARRLEQHGWVHLGEAGVPGREYLRRRTGRHANVHVVGYDSVLWRDDLLLRDYLRSDAAARRRYAAVKREAARRAPTLLAYSRYKAAIMAELLGRMRLTEETDTSATS